MMGVNVKWFWEVGRKQRERKEERVKNSTFLFQLEMPGQ